MSENDDGGDAVNEGETEDVNESEGLQEGDYVSLEYTATTVPEEDEESRLVDTTSEERAAEEGIDTDEQEFGPRTVEVGGGHLFEDVEDALVGAEVGDTGEVVVAAENAFGEHDPDDVETVSAKKIEEDDRYPGAQVNLDGRQGYVETIVGGRARVDFNHPLAGEDVEYEFEVVDVIEDDEEKAAASVEMYAGAEVDVEIDTVTETRVEEDDEGEEKEVEEEVEKRVLYIEATPEMSMNQQWLFSKQQVVDELMHDFDLDRVVIRETFDHDDTHGGMGMPGMMGGMGGDLEDADIDEEDIEDIAEEIEGAEVEE